MSANNRKSEPLSRAEEDQILWTAAQILLKRGYNTVNDKIKQKKGACTHEQNKRNESGKRRAADLCKRA